MQEFNNQYNDNVVNRLSFGSFISYGTIFVELFIVTFSFYVELANIMHIFMKFIENVESVSFICFKKSLSMLWLYYKYFIAKSGLMHSMLEICSNLDLSDAKY